jgi:hypothetical protein
MKKQFFMAVVLVLSTVLFSFTTHRGGDVVRIYLNGRQVHQTFVHANQSAEMFTLSALGNSDQVAVFYSHCGKTGTGRTLLFRNEKNEVVKTLSYPDAPGNTSTMQFSPKDLPTGGRRLQLYYASKELPQGYFIASIGARLTKTASL